MKKRKKIFISNCGCKRRGLDSSRLASYFIKNGCELVKKPYQADTIIDFTCSFKERRIQLISATRE